MKTQEHLIGYVECLDDVEEFISNSVRKNNRCVTLADCHHVLNDVLSFVRMQKTHAQSEAIQQNIHTVEENA